jgi:F-type H+-transporting ATPase subunit delta
MYEYLDRRYALAIYEVAEKKGKVDEYLNDLRSVCEVIENNKDFQQVIRHPQVNTTKKKQLFTDIFKGNIDDDLLSFMIVLIEKNRILYLKEKLIQMEKIDLERRNIIKGVVKTAIPLLPEELEKLKTIFEEKYDKTIIFNTEVDKSIIGGVYVSVGNDVIDGTIKSKIDEMKEIMLKKE